MRRFFLLAIVFITIHSFTGSAQAKKDSIVKRIVYKDSIIYRYDTVRITHYVHSDTVWKNSVRPEIPLPPVKKKGAINPNNWGIGPSFGMYYSPFHGADINIGFGIQYYFLAIPSFRNPHLGHHKKR